jgi:hypothetical protein
MKNKEEAEAIRNLELSAAEAQKRVLDSAEEARDLVKNACELAMSELKRVAEKGDKRNLNGSYQWSREDKNGTTGYRLDRLEKELRDQEQHVDNLLGRMTAREAAVDVKSIQRALQQISATKDSIKQFERDLIAHASDNIHNFELYSTRMSEMQMKSSEYYSVASPQRIQTAFQVIEHNNSELAELRKRFESFQEDRVRRLEETNKALSSVKDRAIAIESKVMERIDRNQIRTQQYTIGIVVGIVVTFFTSMVFAYFRI